MIRIGVIHSINIDERYFSMKTKRKIEYFYLQKNLIKKFQRYLYVGSYISFQYNDNLRIVDRKETYQVEHFISIIRNTHRFRREVYYDINVIRQGIKDLFVSLNNIMFLDLEMTMQSFNSPSDYQSEIIQAGFLIANDKEELMKKNYYIKPTLFPEINKKTQRFLGLNDDFVDKAISFKEFYLDFKKIIDEYHPSVIVWGRNDILAIKQAYKLNDLEPLNINFVNLLQIQKNYFNLKNDLGLFKAYAMYTGNEFVQDHDALEDAYITKEVYYEFKKIVCGEKEFKE